MSRSTANSEFLSFPCFKSPQSQLSPIANSFPCLKVHSFSAVCIGGQIVPFIKIKLRGNLSPYSPKTKILPTTRRQIRKKWGVSFSGLIGGWMVVITFIQKMGRKRIKGTKYNRVTKQQKYVFLKLCIAEKQSIHEAAFNAGIHYSTAKTILFFHKKQYKNYSTYIVDDPNAKMPQAALHLAAYRDIPIDVDQERAEPSRIEIVVNSKKKMLEERMRSKEKGDSTSEGKDSNACGVKLQHVDLDFFPQPQQNCTKMQEAPLPGGIKKEDAGSASRAACPAPFFY